MATITQAPKSSAGPGSTVSAEQLNRVVQEELQNTPIIDMHTHLFMPSLGSLGLWGIDELLTYHYLEAELFRTSPMTPEQYWRLSKPTPAGASWNALLCEH